MESVIGQSPSKQSVVRLGQAYFGAVLAIAAAGAHEKILDDESWTLAAVGTHERRVVGLLETWKV